MNIHITLDVPAGSNIWDTCEEVLVLAKAAERTLTFTFNGHKIYVSPNDTQDDLLKMYNRSCNSN